MKVSLTRAEASALLDVLHGALDDTDEYMPAGYSKALVTVERKISEAVRVALRRRMNEHA